MNHKMKYVAAIALACACSALPYGRMLEVTKEISKQMIKIGVTKAVEQCTPDRMVVAVGVVTVGKAIMR